jgi:pimeloyl-ACP methyl ester carboxylesterase
LDNLTQPPQDAQDAEDAPAPRPVPLRAGGRNLEALWIGPEPAEAPTLVFLHDGLGSAAAWSGFAAELSAATGCGALVYSRAGYGGSDPVPFPRPVSFMHQEALAVLPEILETLEIRKAALVGHSDGASNSLLHAAIGKGRKKIRALALEAPHVFVEPLTLASIRVLGERWESGDLRRKLERWHGAGVDATFESWIDVWLRPEFALWSIQESLSAVTCPVLVIQGESDEFGTLRQVEAIAKGVTGPVITQVLPGCGHSPHHQKRAETLRTMSDFLRSALDFE